MESRVWIRKKKSHKNHWRRQKAGKRATMRDFLENICKINNYWTMVIGIDELADRELDS